MNKEGLVSHVAHNTGWSRENATKAIDETIDGIKEAILVEGGFTIQRMGRFVIYQTKAKSYRNPRTGKTHMRAKPKKRLSFKQAPEFCKLLNK